MRILLINPCDRTDFGTSGFFPLSLGYLAASLENNGHKVRIIDEALEPVDKDILTLFDVIGISTYTPTINRAYYLSDFARSLGVRTILGGAHASALPDEAINYADTVVVGEGEFAILDALHTNGIIKASSTELPSFLPLRPRWKEYSGQPIQGNKTPIASIHTSRGCPYTCAFCFKGIYGSKIRFRDVDDVLNEWQILIDSGAQEITINDDAATTNRERWMLLCNELIKKGLNRIPWTCSNGIRADSLTKDILYLMRRAGCYRISMGIESGDDGILEKIEKRETLTEITNAVRWAHEAKIKTMGFFIFGLPWETKTTMKKTIDFACKLPLDFAQFTTATPYPGTKLFKIVNNGECGTRKLYTDWKDFNIYTKNKVHFDCPDRFKSDDILRMKRLAYLKFYRRPKQGWNLIKRPVFWKSILK